MVLYAGILLNPGDLLEIEFDTPTSLADDGHRSLAQRLLFWPGIHHSAAVVVPRFPGIVFRDIAR